ncbi:MAG: bacteriohemerythrin [Oscillospiraceae bacterium]|nr:bacteriohemerythrin [Oscillospiraceae bacterium]
MSDIHLKHNIFITWKPEYDLGISIIDEQHRGIVTIINSLHYGIQNHYIADMLIPIIDMMYDYTKIHFKIEVDFLERCRFPDLDAHMGLHKELTDKLAVIGKRSVLEHDPFRFMDFLKKWWMDHICIEDRMFKEHVMKYI